MNGIITIDKSGFQRNIRDMFLCVTLWMITIELFRETGDAVISIETELCSFHCGIYDIQGKNF